ncbi:MAG: response regulator [Candidatus Eremiobacteraeota bacterium]|nr:response regulator [Candidatus Eremiobacteraeota bacterium]MCW5867777.1 response regulator [Candidatus Eremiobacteraeota bacterium]
MAKILVVEDDLLFRQTLETLLEQYHHSIQTAESADEALARVKAQNFDLLLTDVRIAGEVDGVETLGKIRKLQPQIRSIIMTGYSDVDAPVRAAGLQADDYLLKPFKLQVLIQSVQTVLSLEARQPKILSLLTAAPGQAANRALRWFYDAHLHQLEDHREQAMRQFYLLVRSKRLSAANALVFFSLWEEIELDFLKHGSPPRWAQLVHDYNRWGKQLLELQPAVQRTSNAITTKAFELLYARVQSGVLQVQHLLKAILLLHFPEARKQSVEDFCTFNWLWGEGSDQGDPFLGISVKGYKLVRQHSGGNSAVRLYEAEAETLPHEGDRVLCLPAAPEFEAMLQSEVNSQRARLLQTIHEHHFLFYSSFAMSLRAKLPAEGMTPGAAWSLLRSVFVQVAEFHREGKASGSFSLRDIDWPPNAHCYLSSFSDAGYRDAHLQLQKSHSQLSEFSSAPEVLYQATPTPASDQAVLGRLLFEVIFGGKYPDYSLRAHIRMLGKPESNRAFAPYTERLKPIALVFYKMAHAEPDQRYPDLAHAIEAMDVALSWAP